MFGNQAKRYEEWQAQRDACAGMLHLVTQGYRGSPAGNGLQLASGETVFYKVNCADLLEEPPGGAPRGRVPMLAARAPGRAPRGRAGTGRRALAPGRAPAVVIAAGMATITSRRVTFQAASQGREIQFARLAGVRHTGAATEFAITGRETPVTIGYGPQFSRPFRFRLDFALATCRGTLDDLVRRLQAELAEIDAQRPT